MDPAVSPSTNAASPENVDKVTHLVLDSGAFIRQIDLSSLAKNFVTTNDVLSEIRDKSARHFLQKLSCKIQIREPSKEAMTAIIEFSRKSGDFHVLSRTDLRVMALTYMLESEENGIEHLHTTPKSSQIHQNTAEINCRYYNLPSGCRNGDFCRYQHVPGLDPVFIPTGEPVPETVSPQPVPISQNPESINHESTKPEPVKPAAMHSSRILHNPTNNGGAEFDDGKNWINLENSSQYTHSYFGNGQDFKSIASTKVACFTTDFTMQNVLLQMNLKLISAEGMLIRRVKQFILRCFGCYATTLDMQRLFCPKCGNNTLERVSYSIDQNGQMKLHLRKNRPTNLIGTKYSIPKFKGGRDGDLLLREDQLFMGIWKQRQQMHSKLKSAFGEYVAHDLGVKAEKSATLQVGFGRRNPNAQRGRERRGKKKS